ncbi:hypothetical protein M501DRAFT_993463 [Patellaria atrata CBS 101060]|uniref:Uncharacterized protein n=1 Tax=Patellaria atrata CBS 101060 TaxID=1346257 RepID=A0A9P4VWH8_9PEZI|nr:hypothetical protein M501DRAFT_993463 [Patellaria atrata CBS 101060]
MESSKSHQLTRQVSTFSQTENELRSQLNIYVEKFKQFMLLFQSFLPSHNFGQVEDTLNNSNDLFLTFRREMEEMNKKTKRLEKENQNLTRKHEATNQSIIKMAEERNAHKKELDTLRARNDRLEKLCRGMQEQGRGQVVLDQFRAEEQEEDMDDESEYEYEDEEGSEEFDDETEDEDPAQHQPPKATFGPPPPTPMNVVNGKKVNCKVNGVRH